MKLDELKKLDKKELVERFPFLQMRDYHGNPAFCDETGEPILEAGANDWGWNDIILCWAEKVKPIYEQMPKDAKDQFYVSQLKEKYGDMRLYLSCYPTGPFEKISEYTTMVEHLSTFTCIVHGILQARMLEWVAVPFSRESSKPRDRTQVSYIAGKFFTV